MTTSLYWLHRPSKVQVAVTAVVDAEIVAVVVVDFVAAVVSFLCAPVNSKEAMSARRCFSDSAATDPGIWSCV